RWLPWLPPSQQGGEVSMALEITETTMTATVNNEVIATATRTGDAWQVSTWPRPLDRSSDITALSLAERVITHGEDDPCVMECRRELAREGPPHPEHNRARRVGHGRRGGRDHVQRRLPTRPRRRRDRAQAQPPPALR